MPADGTTEIGVTREGPYTAELTASFCKAGKHPRTPQNNANNGSCRACQREYQKAYYQKNRVLKTGKPHLKWDGTLEHLYTLGWIQTEGAHRIWHHSVSKVTGRPTMRWNQKTQYPVTLVWELTGHAAVPKDHVLMHDLSLCGEKLCVSPEHHRVVKRGEHVSQEDRAKGHRMQYERFAARSLDEEIERQIVRDETGCWQWTGPLDRKRQDIAHLTFLKEHINVRKYLWTKINGEIPDKHLLQHQADTGCSHSKQCVRPEHLRIVSLQDHRAGTRLLDVEIEKRMARDGTGCWKWTGPVQKSKGGAHLKFLKKYISVRKYLWARINGEIPKKRRLQHKENIGCSHPMECVCPEHLQIVSFQYQRTAKRSLEAEIEKRIVRDETGCWRWTGPLDQKRGRLAYLTFSKKHIHVRKHLWTQVNGEIPNNYILQHKEAGCSYPTECVSPGHMRMIRILPLWIAGHEWPGTLWEPDSEQRCENCRRLFEWHGADECTVRKLGLALNQRHRVCMPKSSGDVEQWITAPRLDSVKPRLDPGKRSVAQTTQPKKQAVIPPVKDLKFKTRARVIPPPSNRALRIGVTAVETVIRESKDAGDSQIKTHGPECPCSKCAPPRYSAHGRPRVFKPFTCSNSPQCRVSPTESRGEVVYCTYCGLQRTPPEGKPTRS